MIGRVQPLFSRYRDACNYVAKRFKLEYVCLESRSTEAANKAQDEVAQFLRVFFLEERWHKKEYRLCAGFCYQT